jgi:hypothetical protein
VLSAALLSTGTLTSKSTYMYRHRTAAKRMRVCASYAPNWQFQRTTISAESPCSNRAARITERTRWASLRLADFTRMLLIDMAARLRPRARANECCKAADMLW